MDEEISYIEELIQFFKVKQALQVGGLVELGEKEIKILENLLTRYKEQEKLLNILKNRVGNVNYKGYRILRLREEEIKDLLGG